MVPKLNRVLWRESAEDLLRPRSSKPPVFNPQPSASFGFGQTPATTQSSLGFSFGAVPTSTPFSFSSGGGILGGSTGFGPTAATTNPGFGGFPAPPTTTGFGGFGTGGGLGFGAAAVTTTSGFSFANKPSTTSAFSFGTNTAGGGGLFNPPKSIPSTGFGFATGFKGFGFPSNTAFGNLPLFGQQLLQQQQAVDPNVALYLAVCAPAYFNDERDEVLKKWNQLQAVWGAGKGYYAQNAPPVEFSPENPFCRFKAISYIKMPTHSAEDGFVEIVINRRESEVRQHQQQIVDTLVKAFNGCQVCVDYVQPSGSEKTQMVIYVQQRNPNGETKKASSWDVYNHLSSPGSKQLLQNLCIETLTPLVALSESQLKEYLEKPPRGIDPMIWEQGKRANPDKEKYLPVGVVGFQEIKERFKAQEDESRLLQGQLDAVAEDIIQLQGKQAAIEANLNECKRRQLQMAHRVLKLVIRQEVERKRGVPIEQGEEQLRMLLEALHCQLTTPTQYMGRLNELLSQISVQPGGIGGTMTDHPRYSLDASAEKDLHQFLAWQQDAMKETVAVVKSDMKIADTLLQETTKK